MYLDISGGWIAGGFKEGAGREQREVVGNVNDDASSSTDSASFPLTGQWAPAASCNQG